jgi:hypothetical protein
MDFEFREGGKFAHPQELTEVSDWGGETKPTHHKFKRRRILAVQMFTHP